MLKKKLSFLLFLMIAILTSCNVLTASNGPPISSSIAKSSSEPSEDKLTLALEEVLGDYASLFPVYAADSYELSVFMQQDSQTLRIVPDLKDVDANKALDDYTVALRLNSFVLSEVDNAVIAQQRVTEYQILVIQAGLEKQDFVIYTYIYQDKLTSWPTDLVLEVLGKEIPEVEAPYFQYQIQQITTTTYALVLACYGVTSSYVSAYTEKLQDADYYVEQYYYYYIADKDDVEIIYYFNTEYNYFYLQTYLTV